MEARWDFIHMYFKKTILIISLALALIDSAWCQDSQQLGSLRSKIEKEDIELKRTRADLFGLESQLKLLQAQLSQLKSQKLSLERELDSLSEKENRLVDQLTEIDGKEQELIRLARERLRLVYMLNGHKKTSWFLKTSNAPDISRNAYFLRKIRDFDSTIAERLTELRADKKAEQEMLLNVLERQKRVHSDLSNRTQLLDERVKQQALVSERLSNRKVRLEGTLTSLRAKALRLETVVASLTGSQASGRLTPGSKRELNAGSKEVAAQEYDGKGLFVLKGSLLEPVKGRLVRGFGKYKVEEFSDYVFSKGLEFAAVPGSPVRAIAKGMVMFVGQLPGFQNVVIINHGKRSYSLYGRIGPPKVHAGTVVEMGDELALVEPLDDRGRNFYFEIRVNGNSINPQKYYTKKF
ncbi:MAG: peptidoglycan DD-metalloendopeptidase family protein [Bdellovibrionales bacterium]|nr:peptidoglycan DD-metalloendopeptidase family protein [Bdellovibrionales bacterium]